MPSRSASVLNADRVWPCAGVPVMVTAPVGASLTLATVAVALLVTFSKVPWLSV